MELDKERKGFIEFKVLEEFLKSNNIFIEKVI